MSGRLRCAGPVALALALALAASSASAHRPWLLPSATGLDGAGPLVTVDAAVSEDLFEFDSFPLALDTLNVTAPDGSALAPEARSEGKRRVSFDVRLPQKGTYRFAGLSDTTMATWKVDGEQKRWRGPSAELAKSVPADAPGLQLTRLLGRAETFVSVETAGLPAAGPAGEGLALQPLTPPTDLSPGDTTRFRLSLDGRPLAQADVTVIRGGNRYRYKMGEIALKTDAAGEFAVTWPEPGRYWLGVNHGGRVEGAAPSAAPARRESYSATFEVLPK